VIAFLPSPTDGVLHLGGLSVHVYGILLATGVVVAIWVTMRRVERLGGPPGEVLDGAVLVVVCGVIGARVYHVVTDYQNFTHGRWLDAFKIWQGGLSIWGAVLGGAVGLVIVTRRRHASALGIADCVVPGLFLAQAIGRWGNWFNQELFGRPTTLPWGLQIDPAHRPAGYAHSATFHPTFLYESIYCLLGAVVLFAVDARLRPKRGQLMALYVVLYTFGRFFFENLRIDRAHVVLGMRINAWVSVVGFVGGLVWFWWLGRHGGDGRAPLRTEPVGGSEPLG